MRTRLRLLPSSQPVEGARPPWVRAADGIDMLEPGFAAVAPQKELAPEWCRLLPAFRQLRMNSLLSSSARLAQLSVSCWRGGAIKEVAQAPSIPCAIACLTQEEIWSRSPRAFKTNDQGG